MARVLYYVFLTFFLPLLIAAQQTNNSVAVGASLIATDNIVPWLSPAGDFAFGFQRINGQNLFVLSVWYDKIPDKTIIWYPDTNPMVPRGSKVELTNERGLVLSDPQGREVWTSGNFSDLAYGFMNDTGNFVLVGNGSRKIWESFSFMGDTILPTQVMARGGVINSRKSETNFTRGRFQLRLLQDGNLVLNARAIPSYYAYKSYYSSNTSDAEQLIFDTSGYMYLMRRNDRRLDLTPRGALPLGDYYHRATIGFDGVFTQYYHPKTLTGNTSWEVIWFEPENICKTGDVEGSGACGFNNVCGLVNSTPTCECQQGFSLLDPSDPNGDCKPDFTPSCSEDEENNGEEMFDFIEFTDIDWPSSDYMHMIPISEQECQKSCLEDCLCAVAVYGSNECWKKKIPLSNGRKDNSVNKKVFLKFRKSDSPSGSVPPFLGNKKDKRSLIILGSVLVSTSMFVNVILIVAVCVGFFLIHKATKNIHLSRNTIDTNVPHYTYQELVEVTSDFKDELGKGAFGIVYKGVIGTNIVAVKKLDRAFQDADKEFKTEINAIARTHHKNLVQLLGYCDDGEQRLLIYEYMSNGTLSDFLFGDMRPTWKQRSYIGVGIAKGLSYLHEGCTTQVIHCDIKPQNILLDEYYNAKIADFGLAKLLMMSASATSTGIRGTKGYIAPEWFRNTPITVKVDVYSFGVLLLEIISCRKSLLFESGNEDRAILTDWAWDCYKEGRIDAFVENDLEALDDYKNLTTFLMVGLWCVQENPLLRPTMRMVTQSLEGVIEVIEPPCPFPSSARYS
ncbi:G-type lectin S-receptor-like serine/threonine-protein kinase LECRK3 [Rutidosis leptorrhynchoides]|uniref:G-type lectin S-receptor-like serine/threonine-protein kinase LECRK3 n=1 Tax=Rutidosis leptorrhynchoides TaxID=125765 RepID=UPI003A98D050